MSESFDRALRSAARRGRPAGVCPDAASLAAYADNALTADERRRSRRTRPTVPRAWSIWRCSAPSASTASRPSRRGRGWSAGAGWCRWPPPCWWSRCGFGSPSRRRRRTLGLWRLQERRLWPPPRPSRKSRHRRTWQPNSRRRNVTPRLRRSNGTPQKHRRRRPQVRPHRWKRNVDALAPLERRDQERQKLAATPPVPPAAPAAPGAAAGGRGASPESG